MLLDDVKKFKDIDLEDMYSHILGLPAQLAAAWKLGQEQPLPDVQGVERVLIAGMGGSAIGADLLASYVASVCPLPVIVHRDYGLPAWAQNGRTLVIASSHSGNTEETISAFELAIKKSCRLTALSTGGTLEKLCKERGAPLWKFEHHGQPRSAVGFSFGLLMALFTRLGWIPNPSADLQGALSAMAEQGERIAAPVPTAQNPAKQLAEKMVGGWVCVIGSDVLAPVARRWKGQINELAKAWTQFEFLPEMNHNTLAGVVFPQDQLPESLVVFLNSASDHVRNSLRARLTAQGLQNVGIPSEVFTAPGDSPLAQMWTAIQMGDYVSYYLAMAYDINPTPIDAIMNLKNAMKV